VSYVSLYVSLTKPRSVLLLLLTALVGSILARREPPVTSVLLLTLIGGALAAAGANALNCYFDRDLDRLMVRTARRPLPTGAISPAHALMFGIFLCAGSLAILGLGVNWLSAALAFAGVVYYVLIYTLWLKRATPLNVVIGGGAGAIPLLVGWAAAAGQITPPALLLAAAVFLWTPPHTWALALLRKEDYTRTGIPMLPVVSGEEAASRQILICSTLLVITTLLLIPAGLVSAGFLPFSLILGSYLIYLSANLWRQGSSQAARRLYRYSTLYLALLFGSMALGRLVALASGRG